MTDPLIGATTASFAVTLSVALSEPVDVAWATKDGTAKAGVDYEAASGVVTFLPGETEKQIQVIVYGQPQIVPDKTFYITLTPPTNAILGNSLVDCIITVVDDEGTPITMVVVAQGKRGVKGDPGLSAYEQAVLMGYTGTVEDWMEEIADASKAANRAKQSAIDAQSSAVIAEQKVTEVAQVADVKIAAIVATGDSKATELNEIAVTVTAMTDGKWYFKTEALLLAAKPQTNTAAKALDTKKVWFWETTDGGATGTWTDTGLSELDQAKKYTDESFAQVKKTSDLIGSNESDVLEIAQDPDGFVYRIIDKYGNVKFSGEKLEMLGISMIGTSLAHPIIFRDINDNVVCYSDVDGNFHIAGDLYFASGSLQQVIADVANTISSEKLYRKTAGQTYQNALINKYPARSEFTSVMSLADSNNLRNRMMAGVKIPTGLFLVWHQQTTAAYDGDGSGSAFWCGFADIDSNYNITVRDRKMFIYPDTDAGIVKHPHLGRTTDGRLILVYEKSIGAVEVTPGNPLNYIKYLRYSSDNGVTWTNPVALTYTNSPPTTGLMALGTTCEVLKLKTGRLVVALYSAAGHCGCIYSDNNGLTWTYSATWIAVSNWGHEPSIALNSDGNLVMSIRPKASPYFAAFAISKDNGVNWTMMHTDRLKSSINQAFLLYDESIGAHIESHTTSDGWVRTNFRMSISYDDCNTFPLTYAPFLDTRYVGYTQLIRWVDGIYLLLMEYNDTFISVNANEQVAIQLFSAKEVFYNVTRT